MPTFEFNSPDGKTYQIDGPEGATADQAFQILQQQIGSSGGVSPKQKQAPVEEPKTTVAGLGKQALAGVVEGGAALGHTLGMAGAGVAKLSGAKQETLDKYFKKLDEWKKEVPQATKEFLGITGKDETFAGELVKGAAAGFTKLGSGVAGMATTDAVETATGLVGQGQSLKRSYTSGAVAGVLSAASAYLPVVGKTVPKSALIGAGGNVAAGYVTDSLLQQINKNNPEIAKQFDPNDLKKIVGNAVVGGVFGTVAGAKARQTKLHDAKEIEAIKKDLDAKKAAEDAQYTGGKDYKHQDELPFSSSIEEAAKHKAEKSPQLDLFNEPPPKLPETLTPEQEIEAAWKSKETSKNVKEDYEKALQQKKEQDIQKAKEAKEDALYALQDKLMSTSGRNKSMMGGVGRKQGGAVDPNAWGMKESPKEKYVNSLVKRHGEDYRAAAEVMWERRQGKSADMRIPIQEEEQKNIPDPAKFSDELFKLKNNRVVDTTEARKYNESLDAIGVTKEDRAAMWDKEKLTGKQKEVYDKYVKPVHEEYTNLVKKALEISKRANIEFDPEFLPRFALNKKGIIDRLVAGYRGFSPGIGGVPSGLKSRSVFVLEHPDGTRMVVKQNPNGSVTAFHNGSTKTLPKADKFKAGNKYGDYTIQQASKAEVEAQTDTKYFSDLPSTLLIKKAEMADYVRQLEFMDNLTKSPIFNEHIATDAKSAPEEWRSIDPRVSNLYPRFKDMKFNPRYAEMLEAHIHEGFNTPQVAKDMTNFLMKSIMLSPVPHIHNEGVHWFTDRGLVAGWMLPQGYTSLLKTFPKAYESVKNQDAVQLALQRSGMTAMFPGVKNENYWNKLVQNELDTAVKSGGIKKIAEAIGMPAVNVYNAISRFSQEKMWFVRDVLATQLTMERMERYGMAPEAAIKSVQKHMPSYRLPTRLGENIFNKVMSEQKAGELAHGVSKLAATQPVAMFSRYHYGRIMSVAGALKDMVSAKGFEQKHAADSLAAMLFTYFVALPMIADPIMQAVSGSEDAKMRRAGPIHDIEAAGKIAHGEEGAIGNYMMSLMTPGPMMTIPYALWKQKDMNTGKPIIDEARWADAEDADEYAEALGQTASDELSYFAKSLFSPTRAVTGYGVEGEEPLQEYLYSQLMDTSLRKEESEEKQHKYTERVAKKLRRKDAKKD